MFRCGMGNGTVVVDILADCLRFMILPTEPLRLEGIFRM